MFKESYLPPWLLLYGLCVPLALAVGYFLATPFAFTSYTLVGLLLIGLAFPILLRWHHSLVIFTWNASLIVFFLPGQPSLGIVMAGCSLMLSLVRGTVRREKCFVPVLSVARSLIFIGVVAAVTALITGGMGGRALGTETWGAKRYLGIFGAIAGYFAMVAEAVPKEKAMRYASIFLLSGITAAFSDLIYAAGTKFHFLYLIFSADLVGLQVLSRDSLLRLSGVAFAAQSAVFFMFLRYGIRGIFDLTRPWRPVLFSGLFFLSLLGGYRSMIILGALVFLFQFWFEKLFSGRPLVIFLMVVLLLGCGMVVFLDKLPLSVQRSLSFLPLDVDPAARLDAQGTLDWRLQIWKIEFPEVPNYLLVGKGFAYSGTDYSLTQEAMRRGMYNSYEDTLISGNYHNGLLTLIIPFGIWGMAGFAWFCWASLRVLHANYRFGESSLSKVNTFLVSFFVARLIFYVVFYGQFDLDLPVFAGIVALSITLNGGVRGKEEIEIRQTVEAGRLPLLGEGVG